MVSVPRLLLILFALPFLLLFTVAVAPMVAPPVRSDGDMVHVSSANPVRTQAALRVTVGAMQGRAYQAPTNRLLLEEESPLPDEDGVAHAEGVDRTRYPNQMPEPVISIAGMARPEGAVIAPPDTTGEMGRDYYVQAVNVRLQVFRRDGVSVLGPIDLGTVWSALGEPCVQSYGDPNVLYDQFAGRWLVTQPIFNPHGALGVCLAVSIGEDPTGTYDLYYFPLEEDYIYDYPMFGVWHDGYYMTANRMTRNWAPAGVAFVAFERDAMLAGEAAQALVFSESGALKAVVADADGASLPDTAPVFLAMRSTTRLRLWRMFPNWRSPEHSNLIAFNDVVVAEHDYLCDGCVAQPDTTRLLGSHANGLAHEASYRDFGTHDSVVLTHATGVPGDGAADTVAVRWYEIRGIKTGQYMVYQQATFAPKDGVGRWMPAAMLDKSGNLLMHYTGASASIYPGIRYTGRLASDPINTLPQGEVIVTEGSGSQTGSTRWGDYATIALDPMDDCTFWIANQYVPETNVVSWATTIAAVRYPDCVPPVTPTPTPTFTPSPTTTATPVVPTAVPTEVPIPPTVTIEAPEMPTATPTATGAPTLTATQTLTPTPTTTVSATGTALPSPTATAILSATGTPSLTVTPTVTAIPEVGNYALFLPFTRRL
jgi:hypothetical protein